MNDVLIDTVQNFDMSFLRLQSCVISTRHQSELNFCASNFPNVQPCVIFRYTFETTSDICPTKLEETLSY